MKHKRKRSPIALRVKLITYLVAVLMVFVYTFSVMATNDDYTRLFAGLWQVFIIAGLMLYLRWQKLGAWVVTGTVLLQGIATVWFLSLHDLALIAVMTGTLSYILPMLLVGWMLWFLKESSPPPDEQNRMRDITRLEDKHDTSFQGDLSDDEDDHQLRRLRFSRNTGQLI